MKGPKERECTPGNERLLNIAQHWSLPNQAPASHPTHPSPCNVRLAHYILSRLAFLIAPFLKLTFQVLKIILPPNTAGFFASRRKINREGRLYSKLNYFNYPSPNPSPPSESPIDDIDGDIPIPTKDDEGKGERWT